MAFDRSATIFFCKTTRFCRVVVHQRMSLGNASLLVGLTPHERDFPNMIPMSQNASFTVCTLGLDRESAACVFFVGLASWLDSTSTWYQSVPKYKDRLDYVLIYKLHACFWGDIMAVFSWVWPE